MPKKRERNSDEYFRGVVRERDKEIRLLRRRLKELEKHEHLYEELLDLTDTEENNEPICSKCKKGVFVEVDLKHVIFNKCNKCGHREKKRTV